MLPSQTQRDCLARIKEGKIRANLVQGSRPRLMREQAQIDAGAVSPPTGWTIYNKLKYIFFIECKQDLIPCFLYEKSLK
jgi:hypothetical protein